MRGSFGVPLGRLFLDRDPAPNWPGVNVVIPAKEEKLSRGDHQQVEGAECSRRLGTPWPKLADSLGCLRGASDAGITGYGGLRIHQARHLKQPETENSRLMRAAAARDFRSLSVATVVSSVPWRVSGRRTERCHVRLGNRLRGDRVGCEGNEDGPELKPA